MSTPKLNLPENYLKWLRRLGDDAYATFDGCEYELAGREDLLELVQIDENEARYIDQAKLFVQSIVEAAGESRTVDQAGNEIPFSRISSFLTIGYDNEDLLCVDPADGFSVWRFYPSEGGDVKKLADSLDQWMNQVKISD